MKNFFRAQNNSALRIMNYSLLFALFVLEISCRFLPKILHEILGVALAAVIIFHLAINRRRLTSSLKKMTPLKIFSLTINFALIICAATTLITGVCMSGYLFADAISFELRRNMLIHQLHVATPYIMLILIGVHIGLHCRELWQRFFERLGAKIFFKATAVILSAVGVAGLFFNRVGDRILMKHVFATPATELPAAVFAIMIIGGITSFATITFWLEGKIFRRGRD